MYLLYTLFCDNNIYERNNSLEKNFFRRYFFLILLFHVTVFTSQEKKKNRSKEFEKKGKKYSRIKWHKTRCLFNQKIIRSFDEKKRKERKSN